MPVVKIVNMSGKAVDELMLNDKIFGADVNSAVLHAAVRAYLMNQRQGTQSTLTRTEVSGGGKKPWRQKGTGRARSGDCKSPIWVGGGTVFGPDGNQNYKLSQNKKAHNLALRAVLSEKVGSGLIVVDEIKLPKISSKEFAGKLASLGASGKKNLIVTDGENENLILSARGIEGVGLVEYDNIAVYDVLYFDNLIVAKDDLKKIEEALN